MNSIQIFHTILHLDQNLGAIITQYGALVYVVLFVIVFCEMGLLPLFFLPGDPLLFISGAVSASGGMNVGVLMAVLFSAAVTGATLNYWLGSIVGNKVLMIGDFKWLNQDALRTTHIFYEKHGGVTFLLSPFIAVVRTFAPFVAGVSAMTFSRFQIFNITGAAVWVLSLVMGGYFFGNIPLVHDHLNAIVLLGIGLGVVALLLGGLLNVCKSLFSQE